VPTSAGLRANTHIDLAARLLVADEPSWLAFSSDQIHRWSEEELAELQWPRLQAAARERGAEWRSLAESQTDAIKAPALLEALEIVHRHALPCDGELWLLDGTASFPRSAPSGASLKRCDESGDLLLVSAEPATSASTSTASAIGSGWRTNDELLLDEGWADEDLRCDGFDLPEEEMRRAASELAPVDEQTEGVLAGLRRLDYLPGPGSAGCSLFSGGYVSDDCGRFLQALSLTVDELEAYGGRDGCVISIGEGVALSLEHEARVGRVLVRTCENLLAGFPTSLRSDEAALLAAGTAAVDDAVAPPKGEGVGARSARRQRAALRSRLGRKRCITAVLERARAWVERPTAAGGTLRRPWKVNVRTSG